MNDEIDAFDGGVDETQSMYGFGERDGKEAIIQFFDELLTGGGRSNIADLISDARVERIENRRIFAEAAIL